MRAVETNVALNPVLQFGALARQKKKFMDLRRVVMLCGRLLRVEVLKLVNNCDSRIWKWKPDQDPHLAHYVAQSQLNFPEDRLI
jgi:hypothetical protein